MDFSKMKYKKFFHFQGVQNAPECEYLMRGYFPGRWSLPGKPLYRPLTNAGSRASESVRRITVRHASHIQQSRYISHLRSRNRGAKTLLQPFAGCKKDRI